MWTQNYQNGFNHSRKVEKGVISQVRQKYLQLTSQRHRQHFFLPRILHQCLLQTQQEESTIYSLIFPQRAPCKRNIDDRAHRFKTVERFGAVLTADHKFFYEEHESRLHHKYAMVVQD